MEELGAVGGREDEGLTGNEGPGVFKGGVAMFKAFGDHAVPFPGGDAVYLAAKLDTFGNTVDGDHTFGTVMQSGSNGGSRAKDVDDDYNGVVHII
jgi:hypothetical protein